MKLRVERKWKRSTYTIGNFYVNGELWCNTIEDVVRDKGQKVKDKTAIPYGTYKVIWSYSPHFKRFTPRLMDVPMFQGVLIHPGNDEDDTSGCIILGENKVKGKVINSRKWCEKLYDVVEKAYKNYEPITIEIV